jgi:hypothetical protein
MTAHQVVKVAVLDGRVEIAHFVDIVEIATVVRFARFETWRAALTVAMVVVRRRIVALSFEASAWVIDNLGFFFSSELENFIGYGWRTNWGGGLYVRILRESGCLTLCLFVVLFKRPFERTSCVGISTDG